MRLTERSLDYCTQHCPSEKMISCAFYKNDQAERCLIANMYDRLAAYEDTGLELEEILTLKSGVIPEHWGDLFRAECEGRLVVLPCKVGDTVYQKDHCGEIYEAVVQSIVIDRTRTIFITSGIGFDETAVGKTVFLSRAEAEKALEGVSEDA